MVLHLGFVGLALRDAHRRAHVEQRLVDQHRRLARSPAAARQQPGAHEQELGLAREGGRSACASRALPRAGAAARAPWRGRRRPWDRVGRRARRAGARSRLRRAGRTRDSPAQQRAGGSVGVAVLHGQLERRRGLRVAAEAHVDRAAVVEGLERGDAAAPPRLLEIDVRGGAETAEDGDRGEAVEHARARRLEPPDSTTSSCHRGDCGRGRDLRAGRRLGRRPPRRCADLHLQPPRARHRHRRLAARHLRERRRRRDRPGQAGGRRQERAGPRRRGRTARARRRPSRGARDPSHPGAPRPGAPPLRQPRPRAHRARATRVLEAEGGVTHLHYR